MKNLLKFTAVVAACTLVSCSNDFDELGSIDQPTAANELKIVAEEMGGGSLTRSAYVSESKNDRVWQETDKFQVFGAEIVGKYDYYKFKKASNKFELDGTKDLTDAAYVAFPAENIEGQNWKKETGAGSITFKIPNKLDYDEVSGTSPVAYISNLPLWGTAENDGEGIKANVYFLTSIIKVYLTNALNNAQAVRIRAYNDIEGKDEAKISGISTVQVSENNVALSASEVQLANPTVGNDDDAKLSNKITVDLGELKGKATNSVVYIPLIAGYYGQVVIEYLPKGADGSEDDNWVEIRTYLDKEFKRGTPYGKGNEMEFEANVTSISGLNNILANMASSASGEVAVGVQHPITDFDAEQTLTVPAMNNVTKLTLNIPGLNHHGTNLTVTGDFAGTLVLNPTTTDMGDLNIQTTKANVVIGGEPATATPEAAKVWKSSKLNIKYAKKVQFGGLVDKDDKEIAVDYSENSITLGAAVEEVIVSEKSTVGDLKLDKDHKAATLNVLGTSGQITVEESALQKATAVKVAGTAGDITINGDDNEATVELTGKLTGTDKKITNEGKGAITISGNPIYAQAENAGKVSTVETKGDVTINLANEGVAIGTKLTFKAPAALTLTQGYVKAIDVNAGDKKTVTCTLGTGYVTLPKPTLTSGKFTVSNVPAWNGEKIGGSFDTDDEIDAIKKALGLTTFTKPTDWATFADDQTEVYTPIGLAMKAGATGGFTLANDINLNNKDWTPVSAKGDINGNGKTISKLNVPALKDGSEIAANAGRGLFTNITNKKVENLTLDGVTINAAPYKLKGKKEASVPHHIGALAGAINGAKIQLVTVKDLTITATGGAYNIGGIAGTAFTAASTLSGVQLTGTNTINGYYNLGGLVGRADIDVTIEKITKDALGDKIPAADVASAATVSFKANYNNTEVTNDLKYLQVGNFIGSAAKTAKIVITDAADAMQALTYDKSIYTGTTKYQETDGGTTTSYDIVFDKQTLIGWCVDGVGENQFTTAPSINKTSYPVYATKPNVSTIAPANQYWLYYINK